MKYRLSPQVRIRQARPQLPPVGASPAGDYQKAIASSDNTRRYASALIGLCVTKNVTWLCGDFVTRLAFLFFEKILSKNLKHLKSIG